jgi:hypothetical protein
MADLPFLYDEQELAKLDAKARKILLMCAVHLVRTSPAVRKIIKTDNNVRKQLRAELGPLYEKLAKKA